MVFYEHDICDDIDVDKYYIFYDGETVVETADNVYKFESCNLQTKQGIYNGTMADGSYVKIPVSDVISFQGSILYKGAAA